MFTINAAIDHHVQHSKFSKGCWPLNFDTVQDEAERDLDVSTLRMEDECIDLGALV